MVDTRLLDDDTNRGNAVVRAATGEPVTMTGLINAFGAMCVAVAIGFFDWVPTSEQYTALAAVQGFVILVLAFVARQHTVARKNVALTNDQVTLLEADRQTPPNGTPVT